ncbi:MAG: sigma-54 dependent transcriptional regulator [Treponema sp.]|jgi:two-component system response regulator AtoC|nr:sigma-54 dependent transcriptional regulator [Treponema sp.]
MKVLIVDDERNIRLSLKKFLSLEDIEAEGAESGEAALAFLEKEGFDAVILDLKLPGMNGLDVLEWMQQRGILSPVIMISAHGQIADAVKALKSGAKDYLVKPFDPAELSIKLHELIANKRRENLIEAGDRTAGRENAFIGNTSVIRDMLNQISKIARSDVTVLITGESGTGKEVAAREIHAQSLNSREPFVAVNIGGIHEGLMESELFGHEKGSFTGAAARKQGLFELAGRGSLFLDEIGEMPMPLQVKLLRVLQERKIRRLGGISDIPINARIISATNRNLEDMVKEGRFREDLYFRLNVIRISLPPLRERREDIPLLASHLLARLGQRMGRPSPSLSAEAGEKLEAYSFPGNVRELENILERAIIYCEGDTIREKDIDLHESSGARAPSHAAMPFNTHGKGRPPSPNEARADGPLAMADIEKQAIIGALERCKGNRTKAANELGISRKTLFNKIREYGL